MEKARYLLQNYRIDALRRPRRRGLSDAGTAPEIAERVVSHGIGMPSTRPPTSKSGKRPTKSAAAAPDRPAVRPAAAGPGAGGRCLSVRQPWASLIVLGIKKVENRSWTTDYRGRLLIHASARLEVRNWSDVVDVAGPPLGIDEELDLTDEGLTLPALSALPLSAIIGSVELFDCVDVDDVPEEFDDAGFAGGPVCWLLRDPRPLAKPFACKGALRLWTPPSSLTI